MTTKQRHLDRTFKDINMKSRGHCKYLTRPSIVTSQLSRIPGV